MGCHVERFMNLPRLIRVLATSGENIGQVWQEVSQYGDMGKNFTAIIFNPPRKDAGGRDDLTYIIITNQKQKAIFADYINPYSLKEFSDNGLTVIPPLFYTIVSKDDLVCLLEERGAMVIQA